MKKIVLFGQADTTILGLLRHAGFQVLTILSAYALRMAVAEETDSIGVLFYEIPQAQAAPNHHMLHNFPCVVGVHSVFPDDPDFESVRLWFRVVDHRLRLTQPQQ